MKRVIASTGRQAPMLLLAAALLTATVPAHAEDWNSLATTQTEANRQPGARQIPGHSAAVPTADVSPGEQAVIANPYASYWNAAPKDAAEWRDLIAKQAAPTLAALPAIREKLGVTSEPVTIAGVKAFIVSPRVVPAANRDRLLLHVHGGGYVFSPGEAATREAVLMAAYGGFRIISVDYRMPPDAPYPAADRRIGQLVPAAGLEPASPVTDIGF